MARQARPGVSAMSHRLCKCPLTRNAPSVFRRKGGESPNGQGGLQSRTTAAEGHPVCTSEALGARKIGEEVAEVAWHRSLTAGGFTPGFHTREQKGAVAVRRTAAKRSPEALGRRDGDVPRSIRVMEYSESSELTKCLVVPPVGIEPTRLAAPDFESGASTSSTTGASGIYTCEERVRQ